MPERQHADTVVMTEAWEDGCDHHCGCTFALLGIADKLAEALRRHAHGGTDCGLCDEALAVHSRLRLCPNCGTEMRFDPGVSGGGAWYCPEYVGAIAPGGRFKCLPHIDGEA